jgi:hypothetical protein
LASSASMVEPAAIIVRASHSVLFIGIVSNDSVHLAAATIEACRIPPLQRWFARFATATWPWLEKNCEWCASAGIPST